MVHNLTAKASGLHCRKREQLGKMQAMVATVATAHKIARTFYHLLKYKTPYRKLDAETYEAQRREREAAALKRKAAKLGFTVVETAVELAA